MSTVQIWEIVGDIMGITMGVCIIGYLGNLAWFHPDKFEKMMIEQTKYHPLNIYMAENYWKNYIRGLRFITALGAIALVKAGIEFVLGIIK